MAGPDFTPQRLFETPDADSIKYPELLDRARIEHKRDHAAAMCCALAAYSVACLVHRWTVPDSFENQEDFDWHLERTHQQVRYVPQDRADVGHLQNILAVLSSGRGRSAVRVAVLALTYTFDHDGWVVEALAMLRLAARLHDEPLPAADFAGLALQAGWLYYQSAAWDRSHVAYVAAGEAARCLGDEPMALRASLGQARALHGQGEAAAAQAIVERVLAAASGS